MNILSNFLNNFLHSGHHFSLKEQFQQFRFALLNTMIALFILFTSIQFVASILGYVSYNYYFRVALLVFIILSSVILYLLRQHRSYYKIIVHFFILNALFLFFFLLIVNTEDQFRLITFFLVGLSVYFLLGKKFGLGVSLYILVTIFVISHAFDLKLSSGALSTFFTFFFIFSLLFYVFFQKLEEDSFELGRLKSFHYQWKQPLLHHKAMFMTMGSPEVNLGIEAKTDIPKEIRELTTETIRNIEGLKQLLYSNKIKEFLDVHLAIKYALELSGTQGVDVVFDSKNTMYYGYFDELVQALVLSFAIFPSKASLSVVVKVSLEEITIVIEKRMQISQKNDLADMNFYIAQLIIEKEKSNRFNVNDTSRGIQILIHLSKV